MLAELFASAEISSVPSSRVDAGVVLDACVVALSGSAVDAEP
jgi:hypothetical protein